VALDGIAGLSKGIAVIAESRAAGIDSVLHDPPDVVGESFPLNIIDRIAPAQWVDPRSEQRFVGVDVSNARNRTLIE
jgi:hypothetical protein